MDQLKYRKKTFLARCAPLRARDCFPHAGSNSRSTRRKPARKGEDRLQRYFRQPTGGVDRL